VGVPADGQLVRWVGERFAPVISALAVTPLEQASASWFLIPPQISVHWMRCMVGLTIQRIDLSSTAPLGLTIRSSSNGLVNDQPRISLVPNSERSTS
jgi:hypothetical protein